LVEGALIIDGRTVPMLQAKDPKDVDWSAYGVDVVLQATRKHRTVAECSDHLANGAEYVILATVPDDPAAIETLVMGVNDEVLDSDDHIISLGSNTSNALAPVLKILDDEFGIDTALFTTVHAMTNEQRLADVPGDSLRLSRAAAENIIPAPTNSPEIIERVLPAVKGKLAGMALNVPVPDGSNVDLVAILEKATTREEVNAAIAKAAAESRILEYVEEPIVSSDVIGNPHSAIFDGLATVVMDGTMLKAIIWFDNGWGYAARAVELMEKLAEINQEVSV
jgi:glyceraldehyde 3-phosphate dehydrogenase